MGWATAHFQVWVATRNSLSRERIFSPVSQQGWGCLEGVVLGRDMRCMSRQWAVGEQAGATGF